MRVLKKVAFRYWMMRAYDAVDRGDGRAALEMALRASDCAAVPEQRKELGYLFYGLDWVNHSLGQFELGMHADRPTPTSAAPYRCYDVQERVYQELLESGRLYAREDIVDAETPAAGRPLERDLPARVWGRIGALRDNLRSNRRPDLEKDADGSPEGVRPAGDLIWRVEQSLRHEGSSTVARGRESGGADLRRYRRRREDREMAAVWDGHLDPRHPRPTRRGSS